MNTPQPSDITILDNLLALNLDISLWSARKKLSLEDFGNVELPPKIWRLWAASGSPRPKACESSPRSRLVPSISSTSTASGSCPAIPEDKAADIVRELIEIHDEFISAKTQFLTEYDKTIQDWIDKHAEWGNIIANSVVSPDYVRARMDFRWQMYKVAPRMEHADDNAMLHAGLVEEVESLGNTLFDEVSRTANDIWNRVYVGKTEVTHKALSPLKTLHGKLMGLSFVEPHVVPVADILHMALSRMPKKGNIIGTDLLTLQGVVCLLRDTDALISHAQKVISGYGPATVLDAVLAATQTLNPIVSASIEDAHSENSCDSAYESDDEPPFALSMPPVTPVSISSMGLW